MSRRTFIVALISMACFAALFLLANRFYFFGIQPVQGTDARLFDRIVTPDLFESACRTEMPFSFQRQPESDGVRSYAAIYRFHAKSPEEHFLIVVGVGKAGVFLDPDRYRRLYKETQKTYADRGTDYLRYAFPSIGKRACRVFFGAGPGGASYGLTFTTDDGRYDVRISVSNLLPDSVEPPDPDLEALARSIEARYDEYRGTGGIKRGKPSKHDRARIAIDWVDRLNGDFAFRRTRSIQCEAWCYEWAGTDSIDARYIRTGEIECFTAMNEATHCSLHLMIGPAYCRPGIVLTSVAIPRTITYPCTGGFIRIDRGMWRQGILKAEFSFSFDHPEDPKRPFFWKGRIYSVIEK